MKIKLFLLCLLFNASSVFASNDRALFWEVKSKSTDEPSATVYLLGSIHFADASFYPLRRKIVDLYDASQNLVVEIDAANIDGEEYKKIIAEKGEYKYGESIEDHISPETMSNLNRQLRALGIPLSKVRKSKPGILVMTLSMVQVLQMGFSPDLGIDLHFLNKDKSKKIIELESLEEQLDLMINMADGELLLKETLTSMEKSSELVGQLIASWKSGDDAAMVELLFVDALEQYPSFSAIYDKLFFERNITMLNKIKRFFDTDETYFVIVGAGHLVGEKGIVNLLINDGYSVRRL